MTRWIAVPRYIQDDTWVVQLSCGHSRQFIADGFEKPRGLYLCPICWKLQSTVAIVRRTR